MQHSAGDKAWYLVYTKPRQEETALNQLVRQGYEAYLPRTRRWRRRQGKRAQAIEPLFPRYLFVHLDQTSDDWGPIRSTIGVAALVRFGAEPARIPDGLIEYLKQREGTDGFHDWAEAAMAAGDRVRIAEGAFKGYEGIYMAHTSRERVLVLLNIVDRSIKMHMAVTQIEHG